MELEDGVDIDVVSEHAVKDPWEGKSMGTAQSFVPSVIETSWIYFDVDGVDGPPVGPGNCSMRSHKSCDKFAPGTLPPTTVWTRALIGDDSLSELEVDLELEYLNLLRSDLFNHHFPSSTLPWDEDEKDLSAYYSQLEADNVHLLDVSFGFMTI